MTARRRQTGKWIRRIAAVAALLVMAVTLWFSQRELRNFLVDDTRYLPEIKRAAERHGVDWRLVRAVVFQESRFDPNCVGSAGELGLMQVLPSGAVADWAAAHGLGRPAAKQLLRPQVNLDIGCYFLARAMRRWQGYRQQTELALCQYNAGESRAARWRPQRPDGEVVSRIGIASTRNYVEEIMQRYRRYQMERDND